MINIKLISVFLGIIAIILNYYVLNNSFFNDVSKSDNDKKLQLFTKEKLSRFNGHQNGKLYLAILGRVYDVTRAKKHYGPGQTYHIFIGRDASRSFITGEFDLENVSDDISGLPSDDLVSLKKWQLFYEQEYIYKGNLIGRYYDKNGQQTHYAMNFEQLIKNAEEAEIENNLEEKQFPPCNIEWDIEHGTRVWCTNQSGGIDRGWVGFPRKYYKPGAISHRCACIQDFNETNPKIAKYDDCNVDSISCYVNT